MLLLSLIMSGSFTMFFEIHHLTKLEKSSLVHSQFANTGTMCGTDERKCNGNLLLLNAMWTRVIDYLLNFSKQLAKYFEISPFTCLIFNLQMPNLSKFCAPPSMPSACDRKLFLFLYTGSKHVC